MSRHYHNSFAVERERASGRAHFASAALPDPEKYDERDLCASCRCPLGAFEIGLCFECHHGDQDYE